MGGHHEQANCQGACLSGVRRKRREPGWKGSGVKEGHKGPGSPATEKELRCGGHRGEEGVQPRGPEKPRDRGTPAARGRSEDVTSGSFRVEGAWQMGQGLRVETPLLAPHLPGVGQPWAPRGFGFTGTCWAQWPVTSRMAMCFCFNGFHLLRLQPRPVPDLGSEVQTI